MTPDTAPVGERDTREGTRVSDHDDAWLDDLIAARARRNRGLWLGMGWVPVYAGFLLGVWWMVEAIR